MTKIGSLKKTPLVGATEEVDEAELVVEAASVVVDEGVVVAGAVVEEEVPVVGTMSVWLEVVEGVEGTVALPLPI